MKGDDNLLHWWRKCVRAEWVECGLCGSTDNLQAHHIIPRAHFLTRWDWRNGILLCGKCHSNIHNAIGTDKIKNAIGKESWEQIEALSMITQKDFLSSHGLTRKEFQAQILEGLKEHYKTLLN
jgi:hypothetical protein